MKICKCGCNKFFANRVYHQEVIIDGNGNWQEDKDVYDAGAPFGPFVCYNCGTEYESLDELIDKKETNPIAYAELKRETSRFFSRREFDVILIEKQYDNAALRPDDIELFLYLFKNHGSGYGWIPIRIESSHYKIAVGYINEDAAAEENFDLKPLCAEIAKIMDNEESENESSIYEIWENSIVLTKNLWSFCRNQIFLNLDEALSKDGFVKTWSSGDGISLEKPFDKPQLACNLYAKHLRNVESEKVIQIGTEIGFSFFFQFSESWKTEWSEHKNIDSSKLKEFLQVYCWNLLKDPAFEHCRFLYGENVSQEQTNCTELQIFVPGVYGDEVETIRERLNERSVYKFLK